MWRSVYVPSAILSFAEGMLVPVLPLYLVALGAPYWLIGLVLAAESIGMLLGDVPAGGLLRRLDHKPVMLIGVAVLGLTVSATGFAGDVWRVLLLRLLAGLGSALWGVSRHAYLTSAVPMAQRGRAIAGFGGAQRIGWLMGPVAGGWVAASYGFAMVFWLYGLVAVVAFGVCMVYLRSGEGVRASGRGAHGGHRAALTAVLREHGRLLLTAGFAQFMAQGVRTGRRVLLPLFGATVLGLDVQQVGWVVSLSAFFDVVMFPVAGLIMDRWGRKHAIVPSFLLQALGMALIPLSGGFVGLALAGSLIGLGNGISAGTMLTVGSDLAPEGALGEFLGVWRLLGDAGALGGPVVVGVVADLLTLPLAAVAVASLGVGAALTFAYGVPETLSRSKPSVA